MRPWTPCAISCRCPLNRRPVETCNMAEGCPRHRRVVIAHPFGGQAQGYHGTLALIAFHFHGAAAQFHKLFRER